MKKIIFLSLVFALAANVSAQLTVDAAKNVGIGTTTPKSKLDVVGNINLSGSTADIIARTSGVPIKFKIGSVLAGNTGSSGQTNVSFGYHALSNTTGSYNTAHGYMALYSNTTGYDNIAVGDYALYDNITGYGNTASGSTALYNNTTGNYNTAGGNGALSFNTTGDYNTAGGSAALYHNTTGAFNVACGTSALYTNTTGSYNTAIGLWADVNTSNLSNTTAVGFDAKVTSSNQVRIGNSSVTSIGGYANWSNFSDKRAKKNIQTDVPGLDFINRLQPVTFNLDLDVIDNLLNIDRTIRPDGEEVPQELIDLENEAREAKESIVQTGFLAQDVEAIAQSIGYDFSGVNVDEAGIYGLRYAEFVAPLVKAVQELSQQVNELTELVSVLQGNSQEVKPTTGLQDAATAGVSLQQNSPNPFNQSTVIRYTLPQTGKQAQLVIGNAAGAIVRQIPLQTGSDSITIEGGALTAGVYYYSLYVGNSLIDTKKMILTK